MEVSSWENHLFLWAIYTMAMLNYQRVNHQFYHLVLGYIPNYSHLKTFKNGIMISKTIGLIVLHNIFRQTPRLGPWVGTILDPGAGMVRFKSWLEFLGSNHERNIA